MQIDERRIAVFIDFENLAMGVRESRYGNFDIDLVLKRLVEKGKITVKRAYSDWHRYTEFKRAFHQAAIELIDVPQSRYSGKNSADIRMVVDALDLSYQRDHIDTFVLVSGDSDFSPLVSKLREYGRYVIGMGVRQSSSDLLINNCDEFIFYEDLVRPSTENRILTPQLNKLPSKKAEALRLVVETFEALQREGKEVIYGSAIKQTLVRKLPSFNESYFGYPSFSRLLEDAAENKLLQLTKDQKSGGYIVNLIGEDSVAETPVDKPDESTVAGSDGSLPAKKPSALSRSRPSRGHRKPPRDKTEGDSQALAETAATDSPGEAVPRNSPKTTEASVQSPPPGGENTQATQSIDPSPSVEKKVTRPRRRYSRSSSSRIKQSTAKATESPATPPTPSAESTSATTVAAPVPVGEQTPGEKPIPVKPPTASATLLSEAATATTKSDSDVSTAPKRRSRTASPRKAITRRKTTRSLKKPTPEPESTPVSQSQDSSD